MLDIYNGSKTVYRPTNPVSRNGNINFNALLIFPSSSVHSESLSKSNGQHLETSCLSERRYCGTLLFCFINCPHLVSWASNSCI
jgi:hypothetical protein